MMMVVVMVMLVVVMVMMVMLMMVMVMFVVVMVMMVIVMRERKGASDPELVVGSLFPPQPLCHSFVVVAVFNSDYIGGCLESR